MEIMLCTTQWVIAMNTKDKNPVKVIAVSSGKGGVGKTNVSINLSMALSRTGKDVLLLDADLGLANVDVLLGLHPLRNLSHVLREECRLNDIIIDGPSGIRIVPAASGVKMMGQLDERQHSSLVHAFDDVTQNTDVLVIDTSAGLVNSVLSFCAAAQEVLVVVCNEPASIADAYALIKVLHLDYHVNHFRIVVNMVDERQEGHGLFRRLVAVCDNYLDVVLELMAIIPRDEKIVKSVKKQRAVLDCYPGSPAALEFKKMVDAVDKWPRTVRSRGSVEFFLEQVITAQSLDQVGSAP